MGGVTYDLGRWTYNNCGATYDTQFAPNTMTYDILRINTQLVIEGANPTKHITIRGRPMISGDGPTIIKGRHMTYYLHQKWGLI